MKLYIAIHYDVFDWGCNDHEYHVLGVYSDKKRCYESLAKYYEISVDQVEAYEYCYVEEHVLNAS
jgi:hypothetical protein